MDGCKLPSFQARLIYLFSTLPQYKLIAYYNSLLLQGSALIAMHWS
jgi:hypothetical protein